MKSYLVLIKESAESAANVSPQAAQEAVALYTAWARKLDSEGRFVTADGLSPESRTLRTPGGGAEIKHISTADAKEIVTGFYVIRAASFDEAQAICEECPALQLGEFVEIREQMEY
jgi:hypothetical protein